MHFQTVRTVFAYSEQYTGRAQLTRRRLTALNGHEIRHVVFAKVHKAASSTMQNIILRFAMARNLSILLPHVGNGISDHESKIPREYVLPHPEGKSRFDILAVHVIYDANEIFKYISSRAVRIAIVREPMMLAVSAFQYYLERPDWDYNKQLARGSEKHKEDPMNGFIQHPEDFYEEESGPAYSFINNRMSVDLGFDLENFEASKKNKTKIDAFIRRIETQFDLILVSDYFDESVVLMRRRLRWALKDIIFLKINEGLVKKNLTLNSTLVRNFRKWSAIDSQLYSHFLHVFLNTTKKEYLFEEELKVFRKIQRHVKNFCLHNKTAKSLEISKGAWTDAFSVVRSDCHLMTIREKLLIQIARKRQTERYKVNLAKYLASQANTTKSN